MQNHPVIPDLSPRERQLLKYAAEGLTDTAIANRLGISEATVGTYWGRVRIKLGPHSRTELVAIVMRAEREAAVDVLRQENIHLVEALQVKGASGNVVMCRDLFEFAPDATLLVSDAGRVEYANVAAHELFGYTADQFQGIDLALLVPSIHRNKHLAHMADYFKDPQRRRMGDHLDTPALHKTGKEFKVHAALSALTTAEGVIVICSVRAVSED